MSDNRKSIQEPKKKKKSIAGDLTISLFLLTLVVVGILFAFLYTRQAHLMRQELEKKADDYADHLSDILIVPIWDYDDEQIDRIGRGFADNILFDELTILNADREPLFRYQTPEDSESRIGRKVTISRRGMPIGYVQFQLSLEAYKENLAWLRHTILLVLGVSLVVIAAATGLLLRRFLRNPIAILQQGLDKVAEGDYRYDFADIHHEELSEIAKRIKEIAYIIRERERSLRDMNEELRQEIATRKVEASEKLTLERKLQQSQKMEALGTLAGGVAHDLNNILSGIVNYPELMLMDLPENSPLRKPLTTIKESGEKAAVVVQDLLTLARRGIAAQEAMNVNEVILRYLNSPEYEALKSNHPDIRTDTDLAEDLFTIRGSPFHLFKAIMNLVSNAAEAMPDGGTISLRTENRYVDKPISGYDDVVEGDYVVLRITDTGIGIPDEDLNRIYEPFFTKKVMGTSGSGLGMAVVWGTVKDHQGYIDVQSVESEGTTFKLYFPVGMEQAAETKIPSDLKDLEGNGESVLIVDDMEDQREIARSMLARLGYRPDSVASGEEALRYVREKKPDLLLLDMIMRPGMDGLETYQEILGIHPGLKAVIASGFSETDRVKQAQRLGAGRYIRKPYSLKQLGIAIKEQLDGMD